MKRHILIFLFIIVSGKLLSQPVINSFAPTSGPIGTIVTINGTNFSSTIANNIVFLGAVKATVSAATATSLTVTVPIGTTYDPITVTTLNNNLTAYSLQPFHVTFPGAGPAFTPTSFDPHIDFNTNTSIPLGLINNDLDDDGKADFATSHASSSIISIFKNTSTSGSISFLPHIDAPGTAAGGMSSGDIDGDGKTDIVTPWGSPESVLIYKNTSTAATISFATPVSFPAGLLPSGTAVGDIDGDGKPDIAMVEGNSFTVSVFRNTSTAGIISFAPRVSFTTVTGASRVLIRDLDEDGKPDLSICVQGSNKLMIYRNISTPGTISFESRLEFAVQNIPLGIAIGDLDGDGKADVAVNNNNSSTISIFRNLSSPSTITFASRVDISVGVFSQQIAIGDIDGDGKLDVAATRAAGLSQTVAVFKNISSPGNISFQPKIEYDVSNQPGDIVIGDIDGDGLPDIAANGRSFFKLTILRNTVVCTSATISSQPADNIVCTGVNASFSVNALNAVSYQWQLDTGTGWVDLTNNATYSGVTTSVLNITATTIGMNNYRYRCVVTNTCGSTNSLSALLTVNNPVAPSLNITASATTICAGIAVTFTAAPTNGGAAPVYQWKKNGINVGTNSATYSDNTLNNGDMVNCVLTSNGTCITTPTATSNSIIITVSPPVTPAVSISASGNNICFGTVVNFTASGINGGSTPVFQWKKNGLNIGTNSTLYTDNALNNGDIITCEITSSLSCLTAPSATSNQIVMIVIPAVIPAIIITPSANNICPGTAVTFSASVTNGGALPVFQWKKNGTNVGTNSPAYTDNAINNGDAITCVLTSSLVAGCLTNPVANSNSIVMTLLNLPGNVNLGPDISGCKGSTITLTPQPGFVSYIWQDNSTNAVYNASSAGKYYLQAKDACNNISSDTILVSFKLLPERFLPLDTSICTGEPVTITPLSNYSQYLWNTNAISTSVTVNTPGLYWLQVTDINNCIGRDSINVFTKNCLKGFYVPTAFTPNSDTKNDIFKPLIFGVLKQYEFRILNRYGEQVFYSKDLNKGWDGKLKTKDQNLNAFTWVCTYQFEGQMVNTEKGTVILLR